MSDPVLEPWLDMPISPHTGDPITPRAWQAAALPAIIAAVRRRERTVVSAVTGAGKSVAIAELCRLSESKLPPGRTIVVSTPTQALVRQLSATISGRVPSTGQYYGRRKQAMKRVIVTCNPSAESLAVELVANGRRCGLLIVDECHKSEADGMKSAVDLLRPGGMIGFTGTPFRSVDSESLSMWDSLCVRYTMADALSDGVLVPFRAHNWAGHGESEIDQVCLDMVRSASGPGIIGAASIKDAEDHARWLGEHQFNAAAIHSRQPQAKQDSLIVALKAGDLRALVHVALLSEGVDLPWLQWLCLRRPIGARVMFIQQLGRVLRCHPGKTHADIYDPHDLLGTHGIAHAPALGEAMEDAIEEDREERNPNAQPKDVILPPATAVDISTQWARMVLLQLQAAGIAQSDSVTGDYWRTRRPTSQQIKTLSNMSRSFRGFLPEHIRDGFGALVRVAPMLQRGAVSDMISVLRVVADKAPRWTQDNPGRRGWVMDWPAGLELPDLDDGAIGWAQESVRQARNAKARARRAARC